MSIPRADLPDTVRSAARLQQPRDKRRGRHVRGAPQRPAHQRQRVLQPPAAARAAPSPYPYPNATVRLREAAAPPARAHSTTAEHDAMRACAAPRRQRLQQRGGAVKSPAEAPARGAPACAARQHNPRARAAHPAHGSSSDGARPRPPPPGSPPLAASDTEPVSRSATTTPSRSRPASVRTHMPIRKGIGADRYSCAAAHCSARLRSAVCGDLRDTRCDMHAGTSYVTWRPGRHDRVAAPGHDPKAHTRRHTPDAGCRHAREHMNPAAAPSMTFVTYWKQGPRLEADRQDRHEDVVPRERVQRGGSRHDRRADGAQVARDQEHAALEQQRLQQRGQLRRRQLPEQARERDGPPGAVAARRQRLQLQPPPRAATPGGVVRVHACMIG